MKQLAVPYWHVDAFADRPFAGNQAAVMPLETWLPDDVLQAIGEENQFAETAFVVRDETGAADWELRWFTPACEIRLCGHATLASGHVLLGRDGGQLAALLGPDDVLLHAAVDSRARVHEIHLLTLFCLSDLIDHKLFGMD